MHTFRLHSQLSMSIRKSAMLRAQLEAGQLSLANRLLLRGRYVYFSARIRKLTEQLHTASTMRCRAANNK